MSISGGQLLRYVSVTAWLGLIDYGDLKPLAFMPELFKKNSSFCLLDFSDVTSVDVAIPLREVDNFQQYFRNDSCFSSLCLVCILHFFIIWIWINMVQLPHGSSCFTFKVGPMTCQETSFFEVLLCKIWMLAILWKETLTFLLGNFDGGGLFDWKRVEKLKEITTKPKTNRERKRRSSIYQRRWIYSQHSCLSIDGGVEKKAKKLEKTEQTDLILFIFIRIN
jgi:hypothetical protein